MLVRNSGNNRSHHSRDDRREPIVEKKSGRASRIKRFPILKYFMKRSFIHYFWTGVVFTTLNIVLLWFAIDILKISTIISSSVIITSTFLLRYVVFRWLGVIK